MSVRQPEFLAVAMITGENFSTVRENILNTKVNFLDPDFAADFMKKQGGAGALLNRVDKPDSPILVDGNRTRIYLWNDPSAPNDPKRMVMAYGKISADENKNILVTPEFITRGPDANIIMFYQMSCCLGAVCAAAGFSLKGKPVEVIKDSENGILHGEHQLLAGKIRVADSKMLDRMRHLYEDMTGQCSQHANVSDNPDLGIAQMRRAISPTGPK